jgi:general secretion pathway protein M
MDPSQLFERFGLNPRERRLLTILAGVLAVMFVLVLPVALEWLVHSRQSDNDELYTALAAVQSGRSQVRERQAKKDAIVQRYAKRAPPLAGFLEQSARGQKLEVTDSVDRPDLPHGKRYVERSTVVHLKKTGMYSIAKFIETIEKSGYPALVSRLNIRKRSGEPDSYDVEIGVSAYDRSEQAAAGDAEGKEKQL